ncbi:hypothetical protein I3842_01G187900 [Carya illinoinensis]|uniref:RNase H type-1 domain-containing protein n=1 Tax=Carya illinoinensis TaxID=32201 RepID=A0A922K900_CARIL|nr:hypothetical protein I3842_01G187900 [Carya illinoinensis]
MLRGECKVPIHKATKYRKLRLFQNSDCVLQEVVGNCFGYVESFNTTKSNQLIIRKERLLSWKPPPSGKSKLNFDGPLLKQSKNVGIGVILRDNKGEVLLALSQKEVGMFDVDNNEVAHLLAQRAKLVEDIVQWWHSYLDIILFRVLLEAANMYNYIAASSNTLNK